MTLPTGLGQVIAIVVLVVAIVLVLIGQLALPVGACLAGLAVARLC